MSSDDLLKAVDSLILPSRVRLHRDDTDTWEWHTLDPLWLQLTESVDWKGSNDGGGAFGSRPVAATGILSLINEIADAATEGAVEHVGKTRGNTPDNLRAVTATVKEEDQQDWWIEKLKGWVSSCRELLQLDPPNSRSARDAKCPRCGENWWYTKRAPKEYVRTPALAIVWKRPEGDDYHADSEWRVGSVECRACTATWERGDTLHLLMDQMLEYNRTVETLPDAVNGS